MLDLSLDMQEIGLKRHTESLKFFDQVWEIDRLHEALGQADYLVVVTPLTAETYHLMGAEEFQMTKNTATLFITVSRGDTVNEDDLIHAREERQIARTVLDVSH